MKKTNILLAIICATFSLTTLAAYPTAVNDQITDAVTATNPNAGKDDKTAPAEQTTNKNKKNKKAVKNDNSQGPTTEPKK